MISKYTEELKNFIEMWDKELVSSAKKNAIALLVEAQNFMFFFLFEKNLFGGTEDSRVVFARLKSPAEKDNPDETEQWKKDATFICTNLTKTIMTGNVTQQVFKNKDIQEIKIVPSKDEAYEILLKQVEEIPQNSLLSGIKMAIKNIRNKENV